MTRAKYGAPDLLEENRHRAANRAEDRHRDRCAHPHKTLQPDGNSLKCEQCQRIVGFLRLPTRK